MTPHRCAHPLEYQIIEPRGRAEVLRCARCGAEVLPRPTVPLLALAPGLVLLAAAALWWLS